MGNFLKEKITGVEYDVWKKILGKETLDNMIENWDDSGEEDEAVSESLARFCENPGRTYKAAWLEEQCFFPFYEPLLAFWITMMEECNGWGLVRFSENVRESLLKVLFSRLEGVSIRVLIREMKV